ncbi:hypothetical protein KUTeg_016478 [Tegillarca granosa]|uniref:Chitin-binding type-4 domain-containing protein n=1 Tax=Tegillarca granosa TaxID=220873 RepID=A0ABQ9EKZ6_TEGGR|nr:hypothetical protein KUTeg_016478 [Tegillarca granosa]
MEKILIFFCLFTIIRPTDGHGRLAEPSGRSSLWRIGYNVKNTNYNDNELNCGGYYRHHFINGGKCGICGDPWDAKPRKNEPPDGIYTKGKIISRTYRQGQEINAIVDITASHRGFFEFKLCPQNNFNVPVTEECLDQYKLLIRGPGTKFKLKYDFTIGTNGNHSIMVKLPDHVTCSQCVLRWRYKTGNSWGCESPGNCGIGLGRQEEFYSCADIRIVSLDDNVPEFTTSFPESSDTTTSLIENTSRESINGGIFKNKGLCVSTDFWLQHNIDLDMWCARNCAVDYCPETHCVCGNVAYLGYNLRPQEDLKKVSMFKSYTNLTENHQWCDFSCRLGLCPQEMCFPVYKL